MAGVRSASTVVDDSASSTGVPSGARPVAVPVLLIDPRSRSACVVVCVAVHVTLSLGANVVTGQLIADKPDAGSVTSMLFTVTFPVLVTRYEYVIVVPTASKVVGFADFRSVISGFA